jgi:hypothetical protein
VIPERRAALTKGVSLMAVGAVSLAFGFARLATTQSFGAGFLVAPGLLGVGAWYIRDALFPAKAPVLAQAACWECTRTIEGSTDGVFCSVCARPVHRRCLRGHERLLHG